jgi:hypothetical protein
MRFGNRIVNSSIRIIECLLFPARGVHAASPTELKLPPRLLSPAEAT